MLAIERRGFAANLGAGRKAPCRAATTASITLVGEQTIDGVAVVADDRVLVKSQSSTIQNAVYVCKTGDWELASDFNQRGDVVKGSLVFITDGTSYSETEWYVSTSGRPWPGRETIQFTQYIPDVTATGYSVSAGNQAYSLIHNDSSASARTANTAAIQAAIDYAYANGLQVIHISAGVFYCDPGIYLDPPGNLRSNLSTPTIFAFSLHLKGAGGLFNSEGHGTQLRFTDNSTNAVIVGSGRGMRVSDLSVIGPSGANSRAALSTNGIGIALSGYLSRCLLDNVGVINFRKAYVTGFNTNTLCDSVTLSKCVAFDCHTGLHVKQTQNYIVNLFACDFGGNAIHVLSDVSKAVNVHGGNFSTSDGKKATFAVTSVTWAGTFSDTTTGDTITNREVTAVISSPDQAMDDGAYDAFVLYSAKYGPIPLVLRNWDTVTNTATFGFLAMWFIHRGASAADTVLEAEVEAATTLYACERITTFKGMSMNVNGAHVENPASLTTFHHHTSGFGGDRSCVFNRITFNYTITQADLASGTEAEKAVWYCQQSFPFVESLTTDRGQMEFSNISNTAGDDRVIVDIRDESFDINRLVVRNCDLRLNIRSTTTNPNHPAINDPHTSSIAEGVGNYDTWMTPWGSPSADVKRHYRAECYMSVPFKGHFPQPGARLRMHPQEVTRVTASPLGTIGDYPPLMGGTMYDVDYSPYSGDASLQAATATRRIESVHNGFSWGQDITAAWSYTGGTRVVWVSSANQTYLFQGLVIKFDSVDAAEHYIITGLFPTLGFITVIRRRVGTSSVELSGTVGTLYSGAAINQQAFSFVRTSSLPASTFTTNTSSGAATAASGDLTGADFVNIKLTAIGSTNYTTRTAAQMFSDIPGCYSGYKYTLAVCNVSTGNTVLAGGSNVTVNSTGNIPASSVRQFEVRFTSTAAVTIDGQTSTST